MTNQTTLLCALLLIFTTNLFSQETIEPYLPLEYNQAGITFANEEGDFKSAAKEFAKIHPNDTLYAEALFNRVICLRNCGEFEKALKLADEGIELEDELIEYFFLNKVWLLDSLDRMDDAFLTIDQAIKAYPFNYNLKKAKAPLLEKANKYDEAWEIYKLCIRDEPINRTHHVDLAKFALKSKGTAQAVLAIAGALALQPDHPNNLNDLSLMNDKVAAKPEYKDPLYDNKMLGDEFSEINELIHNYVALDESYKVPGYFQFDFIKQLYLVITESEMNEGFFSKTYLKPFKELADKDLFPYFAALVGAQSTNEYHQDYIKKNKQKIIDTRVELGGLMSKTTENRTAPDNLTNAKVDYLFNDSGKIDLIAEVDRKNNSLKGPAIFINPQGSISSKGVFDDKGELLGDWTWFYPNGVIQRESGYKNGLVDGKSIYYNEYGDVSTVANFKDGKLDGVTERYKFIGYKYEEQNYKNDLADGSLTGYYPDNSVYYTYEFKNGMNNGPYAIYYEDGSVKAKGEFVDGQLSGEVFGYYRGGQLEFVNNYKEGELHGEYISYFKNGKIENNGFYTEGKVSGIWKEYNSSGTLIESQEFDEKGKINGPSSHYDFLGRLETVYVQKKGVITELINYDSDGQVSSSYKKKGKTLKFVNTNTEGGKILEAQFVNNKKEGQWKYYKRYGDLADVYNYEDDVLSGTHTSYYSNNVVRVVQNYKDGELDGLSKEFFENGNLKSQAYYVNGKLEGRVLSYNVLGEVMTDLYYINDQQVGENFYYNPQNKLYLVEKYEYGYLVGGDRYDPNGELTSTFKLVNGNGVDEYPFYKNGTQVLGSNNYLASNRHGESLRFYIDGTKRAEYHYLNDNYHGTNKRYSIDGKLKSVQKYDHGIANGVWEEYHHNGSISNRYEYKHGLIQGEDIYYHDNGKKFRTLIYDNGYLLGSSNTYNLNEDLVLKLDYQNDVAVGYYSPHEPKELKPIITGNETIETKFENGNTALTYTLKSGSISGEYKIYFSDGQLFIDATYENGDLVGTYKDYYPNGKLRTERNYIIGIYQGTHSFYYEDGKLKRTEEWIAGEKFGPTKYYNENGELERTINYIGNVPCDVN